MIVKNKRKFGAIVYLFLAIFLVSTAEAKKPSDAQVAKFKANY